MRKLVACLPLILLPACVGIVGKKHTYSHQAAAVVNGADVALRVKPEGTAGGSFAVSAMVVGAGMATLDGPFRWRVEATGREGDHQSMVIHRLRTVTAATRRDEWFPADKLGKRIAFRSMKSDPGKTRAAFDIPGLLQVKPREDGALTIYADISVQAAGKWQRRLVKFHLDPAEKRQDEFLFLPAEVVKSIGTDPADWQDAAWD